MLDESTAHYREVINHAIQLLSNYFQKPIHFSKVTQLSEPGRRNVILRLQVDNPSSEIPSTLILKMNSTEKQIFDRSENETEVEQLTRFAHDWAGIEFLTQIGSDHGPKYYVGSLEHKFIVIEDLGLAHPSLVGPLTRASSVINIEEAKIALHAYVKRLGKMHADTAGKFDLFTSILKRIYPQALRFNYILESDSKIILNQFKTLVGIESTELSNEVHQVIQFSQSKNEFNVLLHGDICPDNVYYQKNKMYLIDFEFSDFGNALVDGTYLRMHMPTCWCSRAIPLSIIKEMEIIYREELSNGIPSATDDEAYNKQLTYSCAYWLLRTIKQLNDMDLIDHEWICPSGPVDADSKWEPNKNAFRPRILSRLKTFIVCSETTGHLPMLRNAAALMQSHLKKIWPDAREIDMYPVFKS